MRGLAIIIVGLIALARPARADDSRDDYLVMLLGGIDFGGSGHPNKKTGGLFGLEGSIPYLDTSNGFWVGGYTDVLYDSADSATRLSIGPEIGWAFVGLDAGFVQQFGGDSPEGGSRSGVAIRPCITVGFVSIYYRHVTFFDDQPGSSLNEFGVLLKYGRPLSDHSGHW